jgi:hypothetical protein
MLYYKLQDFGKEKCARAVTIRDSVTLLILNYHPYHLRLRKGGQGANRPPEPGLPIFRLSIGEGK